MSRSIKIYTPDRSQVAFKIDTNAYRDSGKHVTNFLEIVGWSDGVAEAKILKILNIYQDQYYGIPLADFLKMMLPAEWRIRL